MMEMGKLILAFAPWLAFWFISGPSILRLHIALFVAAALVIIMAITKLHKGAILWAGYVFFSFALVTVVWLKEHVGHPSSWCPSFWNSLSGHSNVDASWTAVYGKLRRTCSERLVEFFFLYPKLHCNHISMVTCFFGKYYG